MRKINRNITAVFFTLLIMMTGCNKVVPYIFAPSLTGEAKFTNQSKLVFTWEAVAGATKYEFKIADGEWQETTDTLVEVDSAASGTYVVTVRAVFVDEDGNVKTSKEAVFTVVVDKEPPAAPTLTVPGLINDSTPTWKWSVPADATQFQYSLDGGAWIIVSEAVTTFTPESALAEGDHTLQVKAGDKAGNWSPNAEATVTIDLSAPDVPDVISTVGAATAMLRPTWQWTPVADTDAYRYQLDHQFEDRWIEVDPSIKSYTPAYDLPDGDHLLYVQSKDILGNWSGSGSAVIAVDTTPPAVPVVTGAAVISHMNPDWSWDIPETTAGFEWRIEGQGAFTDLPGVGVTTYTEDVSGFGDGSYTFIIVAYDSLGNKSAPGSFTTVVTTAAGDQPVVRFPDEMELGGKFYTANIFPKVTWALADGSTPYEFRWTLDGGTKWNVVPGSTGAHTISNALAEGTVLMEVQSRATNIGAWSASGSAELVVDLTAPSAPVVNGSAMTGNLRPTWSWNPDLDVQGYRYRVNGGYWIVPEDNAATPENEALATSYQVPSDLAGNDAGIDYTFEVQAIDLVGNWSASGSKLTKISTSTPDAPVVTSVSGVVTSDSTPTWSWTIPAEAVAVQYKLGSEPVDADVEHPTTTTGYTPASPLEVSGNTSDHTLYVRIKNALGVWSGSGLATVQIDLKAPGAPTVFGDSVSGEKRPVWNWLPADAMDADRYAWKIDNDTGSPDVPADDWNIVAASVKSATPTSDLADGARVMYVRTSDSLGNWSLSGSHIITLNTTALAAPSVVVDNTYVVPGDFGGVIYVNNAKPSFNWTHAAPADVVAYRYRFNSGSWRTEQDETLTSFKPSFDLDEGDNLCDVQVQNIVGNWSASGSFTVKLDSQAPAAPLVTSVSPVTSDVTPLWSWSHSSIGEVAEFRYKLGVAPAVDWVVVSTSTLSFAPGTALAEGAYALEVQARDAIGNWSISGRFSVTIDSSAINYGIPQPVVIKAVSSGDFSQGVRIEWVNDPEATSYTVHRLTQADVDGGSVFGTLLQADVTPAGNAECGVDGNNIYFYDTTVPSGDSFYYRVKGKNPDGEGELSLFKVTEHKGTALGAYNASSASVLVQRNGYRITWPACEGARGYYIFRSSVNPEAYSTADWGTAIAYEPSNAFLDTTSGANLEQDEMWYRILPASELLVAGDVSLTQTADATALQGEVDLITGYTPKVGFSDYSGFGSDYTVPVPDISTFSASRGAEAYKDSIHVSGALSSGAGMNKLKVILTRTCSYGDEAGVYPLLQPEPGTGSTRINYSKVGQALPANTLTYELTPSADGSFGWNDPMPDFDENGSVSETGMKWKYKHWDREAWKHILRKKYVDTTRMVDVHYVLRVERTCDPTWGAKTSASRKGWPALSDFSAAHLAMWLKDTAFNRLWHISVPRYCWDNTVAWLKSQSADGASSPGKKAYINVSFLSGSGGVDVGYSDFPGHEIHISGINQSVSTDVDVARDLPFVGHIKTPYYDVDFDVLIKVRDWGLHWGLYNGYETYGHVKVTYSGYDGLGKAPGNKIVTRAQSNQVPNTIVQTRYQKLKGQNDQTYGDTAHGYSLRDSNNTPVGDYTQSCMFTRINFKWCPVPVNSAWKNNPDGQNWTMVYEMNPW